MTTVVNIEQTDYEIYIGRPGIWGNPFKITKGCNRTLAIEKYRQWIKTQPHLMGKLWFLRGKVLGCHCKPLPCHGDVLAELADNLNPAEQIMPFGKYVGKRLDEIPITYLDWLIGEDIDKDLSSVIYEFLSTSEEWRNM